MVSPSSTIGSAVLELRADYRQLEAGLRQARQRAEAFGKSARSVGLSLGALSAPVVGLGAVSVRTFARFEQNMAQVRGITGATGEEFEALTETAKELGRTTAFTATEASEALRFLGMTGLSSAESIEALPRLLTLASAGALELGEAADIATNIATPFNISAADMGRVVDVLAAAATGANTNVRQMGVAMSFAAPVAQSAGIEFEEAAAAIALMGNSGIQATRAGTAMRGGLTRLLKPTGEAAELLDELGIQTTGADGKMRSLTAVFGDLAAAELTTEQRITIFGQEALSGMNAVLEGTADGSFPAFIEQMRASGGTAQRLADTNLDNLSGSITLLRSGVEGAALAVGETLAPSIRGLAEFLTRIIPPVTEFISSNRTLVTIVAAGGAGLAALAVAVGGLGIVVPAVATGVGVLTGAVGALSGAAGVSSVAIRLLWTAISGPFAPLVLAITVGTAALIANWDRVRGGLVAIWDVLRSAFLPAWDSLIATWQRHLQPALGELWELLSGIFRISGDASGSVAGFAGALAIVTQGLGLAFRLGFLPLQNALTVIGGTISALARLLRGDFRGAWEAVQGIVIGVAQNILGVFGTTIPEAFARVAQWALELVRQIAGAVNHLPGIDIDTGGLEERLARLQARLADLGVAADTTGESLAAVEAGFSGGLDDAADDLAKLGAAGVAAAAGLQAAAAAAGDVSVSHGELAAATAAHAEDLETLTRGHYQRRAAEQRFSNAALAEENRRYREDERRGLLRSLDLTEAEVRRAGERLRRIRGAEYQALLLESEETGIADLAILVALQARRLSEQEVGFARERAVREAAAEEVLAQQQAAATDLLLAQDLAQVSRRDRLAEHLAEVARLRETSDTEQYTAALDRLAAYYDEVGELEQASETARTARTARVVEQQRQQQQRETARQVRREQNPPAERREQARRAAAEQGELFIYQARGPLGERRYWLSENPSFDMDDDSADPSLDRGFVARIGRLYRAGGTGENRRYRWDGDFDTASALQQFAEGLGKRVRMTDLATWERQLRRYTQGLQQGGIVPATPGGRLVTVAEGGQAEVVAPLERLADIISRGLADLEPIPVVMAPSPTLAGSGEPATRVQISTRLTIGGRDFEDLILEAAQNLYDQGRISVELV